MTDAELREHREVLGWMISTLERLLEDPFRGDRRTIVLALAEARHQFDHPGEGDGEGLCRMFNLLVPGGCCVG